MHSTVRAPCQHTLLFVHGDEDANNLEYLSCKGAQKAFCQSVRMANAVHRILKDLMVERWSASC